MKLRRREVDAFSMSFLDCICCGFGAIILLLVVSEFGDPVALEKSAEESQGRILKLQEELYEIRGEVDVLTRQLKGRDDTLERERFELARAAGDLSKVQGQYKASQQDASVANIVEAELVAAHQTLSEQMKRLLQDRPPRPQNEAIGGIPIDSEYVIFLIDTSGSMVINHWEAANQVMNEILDMYPRVKGLQILNDNGTHMFDGTRGKWLQDSPGQRRQIIARMKTWRAFSDSNPVDGIAQAIRTYWSADKGISIYVIGDEFTGDSMQVALDLVNQANRRDTRGERRVRIHAIGFPEGPRDPPFTNIRFASLMRMMCNQNGGTFVTLN